MAGAAEGRRLRDDKVRRGFQILLWVLEKQYLAITLLDLSYTWVPTVDTGQVCVALRHRDVAMCSTVSLE